MFLKHLHGISIKREEATRINPFLDLGAIHLWTKAKLSTIPTKLGQDMLISSLYNCYPEIK